MLSRVIVRFVVVCKSVAINFLCHEVVLDEDCYTVFFLPLTNILVLKQHPTISMSTSSVL